MRFKPFYIESDTHDGAVLLRNKKTFYIGAIDLFDGWIEETHSKLEDEENNSNYENYFTHNNVQKIKDGKLALFTVARGLNTIKGKWINKPFADEIIYKIKLQIRFI